MREIIKMIFYRVKNNKGFLITYLVIIPIIILIAILLTNNFTIKANIAIVGREDLQIQSDDIKVTILNEEPRDVDLVLGKYDAVVIFQGDAFEIKTTRGEETKQAIEEILKGNVPNWGSGNTRGAVSNIFGFNMMIILMLGVQLYKFYFDERNGINKRIISTNISYTKYLFSHFIVVFLFLFVPACIMIISSIFIFQISTAVTILQILFILFVLCLFATSFGLFLNTLAKSIESSMMIGNMIMILTTIISGSFVAVTDNKVFTAITKILPQKQIMDYTIALENKTNSNLMGIIYIIGLSAVFTLLGIWAEKKLMANR